MVIQRTPPLGWPHTEAVKYAPKGTREILRSHPSEPPKPKKSGCGVGCMIWVLIILAIAGVLFAILVSEYGTDLSGLEMVGSTDFEAAESTFLEVNPTWEVESADYPDTSGSVRLVTWDYDRSIGRLVIMNPSSADPGAWTESPLLIGAAAGSEEEFLNAFGEAFSGVQWSYAVGAEPSGETSVAQLYDVFYHVWAEDTSEWSEMLTTSGELQRGMWAIRGAGASGTTTATP